MTPTPTAWEDRRRQERSVWRLMLRGLWEDRVLAPHRLRRRSTTRAALACLVLGVGGMLAIALVLASFTPQFAFEQVVGGQPVRWNPCAPIHYVVNWRNAPDGARGELRSALAQASAATGIRFVDDGETSESPREPRPAADHARYGSGWSPVLVAWTHRVPGPGHHDFALPFGVHGETLAKSAPLVGARDRRAWVTGQVLLNADMAGDDGVAGTPSSGYVLRHELGHLLGLAHVQDDRSEVMYFGASDRNRELQWGEGDRAGLRRLGAAGGCLHVSPP